MIVDRVTAGVLAVILIVGFAIMLIRRPSPNLVVAMLQLLPIPAAGFAFYALNPGRRASSTIILGSVGLIVLAVAFGVLSSRLIARIRSGPFTLRTVALQSRLTLAIRVLLVLALSGYLLAFEPAFAVANIAANGVWAVLWVPRRWRQAGAEVSIEIPVSPERVRAFIGQPSNWPRFDVDLQEVVAAPPGPLKVGSTITMRRRARVWMPRSGIVVATIQTHSVVTEATAESTTIVDHETRATTTTGVRPEGMGSRVSNQTRFVLSVSQGIDGVAFQMPWMLSEYRSSTEQSLARLKDLLTAPS